MEEMILKDDVNVGYVTANSFPGGVMDAHKRLHALVPFSTQRKYFGMSRPEYGPIVYRAATEVTERGEAEKFGENTLVIQKGKYISEMIVDFMKDISSI